jgi:hypothetical protein
MKNREKAKKVFLEELSLIKSKEITDFVLECFDKLTPEYFWEAPASSSNKYHPEFANTKYGIIKHVKFAVWWGIELSIFYDIKNVDIIIASLLLHDLQKFGESINNNLINHTQIHGPILASQMENLIQEKVDNLKEDIYDDLQIICTCVALHMGRWTDISLSSTWNNNKTSLSLYGGRSFLDYIQCVAHADYASSRKTKKVLNDIISIDIKGRLYE